MKTIQGIPGMKGFFKPFITEITFNADDWGLYDAYLSDLNHLGPQKRDGVAAYLNERLVKLVNSGSGYDLVLESMQEIIDRNPSCLECGAGDILAQEFLKKCLQRLYGISLPGEAEAK